MRTEQETKRTRSQGENGGRYVPKHYTIYVHPYLLKSNSMRLISLQILKGTACKLLSFNKSVSSVGENSAEGSSQSVFTSWPSSCPVFLKNGKRFGVPACGSTRGLAES